MDKGFDIKKKIKQTIIGDARDIKDSGVFQKISLIAFFAWVGLGSDPLSSSCYGPEEIFRTLGTHSNLAIFAAILAVITIFVISTSYRQIIRLFPHGGGGYIVATKLISPTVGMVSGSALLIDYVLTITLSVSSGSDAIFSFLPPSWSDYKLLFAFAVLSTLIILNLRGVKESVMILTPVFILFILTHIVLLGFGIFGHASETPQVISGTVNELNSTVTELGILGTIMLILRSYSMGAGTYTGIEAVSNGIPNLREPRTATAQKTMLLLSFSLAIAVFGLMISYYLYDVKFESGKTLNAVLTGNITADWSPWIGKAFIFLVLISEAALLFVAAQTGFLDGPRVMANMATDYWLPRRFMHLSDRLVSQNGILIMGAASFVLLYVSKGLVSWLVILYSINVFITFTLSQFGMVRHWISVRKEEKKWLRNMLVNGIGLIMTTTILITVIVIKFQEGGWVTILITGMIALLAIYTKRHYNMVRQQVINLQKELRVHIASIIEKIKTRSQHEKEKNLYKGDKTAILLVNGYTGLGQITFLKILNSFGNIYKHFVFVQVGILDAQNIRGHSQVEHLRESVKLDLHKFQHLAFQFGIQSDIYMPIGTDVVEEVDKLIPEIVRKYPNPVFVGGQLIFNGNAGFSRLMHNYTIFTIQRNLYKHDITTVVVPVSLNIEDVKQIAK